MVTPYETEKLELQYMSLLLTLGMKGLSSYISSTRLNINI